MIKKITLFSRTYFSSKKKFLRISIFVLLGFFSFTAVFSQVTSAAFTSNFTDPTSHYLAATPPDVTLGVVNNYNNPARVADNPVTNFSDLFIAAAVNLGNTNVMHVEADLNLNSNGSILSRSAPAGSDAGFVIDNSSGLLNVLLSSGEVILTTYLNGVEQESSPTASNMLIGVRIGNSGTQQDLHFTTTKPYNRVGVSVNLGAIAVTALYDLKFYYAYTTGQTILPVSLASFNAVTQGKAIKLGWTTTSESNNKGFAVERSSDAINFSQISYVVSQATNGNSSAAINYETFDESPLSGINYYRLKQIDIDGNSTTSNIVSATSSGTGALAVFKVFPNPATNLINLQAPSDGNYLVELFTVDGKKVQSSQLSTGGGLLNFNINKIGVKTGIYSIKVTNTNGKGNSFYNTVFIL